MGVALVVGTSIVLALMRGGRTPVDRRGWALLCLGVLTQVVAERSGISTGLCLTADVVAYAAVLAFWLTHRPSAGLLVFTGGVLLNLLVIGLNGWRLPSDAALASALRFTAPGPLHTALTAATRMPFLADVIPLQTLHELVSPGELVMMAGIFLTCQEWCGRPIRFRRARRAGQAGVGGRGDRFATP